MLIDTNNKRSWRVENIGQAERTHWNVWTLPVEWKNHLQPRVHNHKTSLPGTILASSPQQHITVVDYRQC